MHAQDSSVFAPDPRSVARNIALQKRVMRLRSEANQLLQAARIAGNYQCPAIENALNILAKRLFSESTDLQRKSTRQKVKNNG